MTVVVFSSALGNCAYADANLTFLGCRRAAFLVFRIVALFSHVTSYETFRLDMNKRLVIETAVAA